MMTAPEPFRARAVKWNVVHNVGSGGVRQVPGGPVLEHFSPAVEVATMSLFRPMLVFGMALVLALGASPAFAEKPGKKKGVHGVHGVVLEVQKDKDKDEGLITVRVHQRKKGEATAAQGEEKKFRVNSQTKFEIVSGKKGERERKPATFAAVHKGEHVLIVAKRDLAERVEIVVRAKGKKETKTE